MNEKFSHRYPAHRLARYHRILGIPERHEYQMADIDISQAEADALIAMEKHSTEENTFLFPLEGGRLSLGLTSPDKRENFSLDITRGQIKITKATYQNRARQAIVLMQLDIDGPPHSNPDGQQIPCPHLHVYREGHGDKWAIPAPAEKYPNVRDLYAALEAFMRHCNVTQPPIIDKGLFA